MAETNSHRRYGTIDHVHLDWNSPDDYIGLHAVKAADGRWFLEVESEGDAAKIWRNAPEICDRFAVPFREPTFYSTIDDAIRQADRLYHQILSRPTGELLKEYALAATPGGLTYKTIVWGGRPIWVCRPEDALDIARFRDMGGPRVGEGATWRPATAAEIAKWNIEFLERVANGDNPVGLFAVEPPV